MSGADDFGGGWGAPARGMPPTTAPPPPAPVPPWSPPQVVEVVRQRRVHIPIKTLLVLAVLAGVTVWTVSFVHRGNRALTRKAVPLSVSDPQGVANLRLAMGDLDTDLQAIGHDAVDEHFAGIADDCRKLGADARTARGAMPWTLDPDARNHLSAALTLFDQSVEPCVDGDHVAAGQTLDQGLDELSQATIALNR